MQIWYLMSEQMSCENVSINQFVKRNASLCHPLLYIKVSNQGSLSLFQNNVINKFLYSNENSWNNSDNSSTTDLELQLTELEWIEEIMNVKKC